MIRISKEFFTLVAVSREISVKARDQCNSIAWVTALSCWLSWLQKKPISTVVENVETQFSGWGFKKASDGSWENIFMRIEDNMFHVFKNEEEMEPLSSLDISVITMSQVGFLFLSLFEVCVFLLSLSVDSVSDCSAKVDSLQIVGADRGRVVGLKIVLNDGNARLLGV